jgi:ubiquinone/menaquinone biosynthesis C-methylase UbiE
MTTTEVQRIRDEYARRDQCIPRDRYSLGLPANLFARQQKSRLLLKLLRDEGVAPLEGKRILDVGCGDGQQLLDLVSWGAERAQLAGIDLLEDRVARASTRLGGGSNQGGAGPDLRAGDASRLPWPDESFDIAHQSTVFTSIIDVGMKRAVAREIVRVLKPGGVLIWYDFLFNNPRNSQVRGIGAREIRSLFPGCAIRLSRTTLAPPIARNLVPITWIGALVVEKLGLLNTHYLAIIRRPGGRLRAGSGES